MNAKNSSAGGTAALLEQDLRAALSRIADAIPVEPTQARSVPMVELATSHEPFVRRRFLPVAAALAAAAVLVGLFVVSSRSTEEPVHPTTPPVVNWRIVPDPDGVFVAADEPIGQDVEIHNQVYVSDVITTSLGLLAVGTVSSPTGYVGAVWTSPDGNEWARLPDDSHTFGEPRSSTEAGNPGGTSIAKVVEADGKVVAIGTLQGRWKATDGNATVASPLAWISADGARSWARVELPSDHDSFTYLTGLAYHDGVFVATGGQFDGPGISGDGLARTWRSTDGLSWTMSAFPDDSSAGRDVEVSAITSTSDHLVAAGSAGGHAASWTSADGIAWDLAGLDDGGIADDLLSRVQSLAVSNGVIVAIGSVRTAAGVSWTTPPDGGFQVNGVSGIAIWTSRDGVSWHRERHPESGRTQFEGPIGGGPDGFVTVSRELRDGQSEYVTMTSADGHTWTEQAHTPTGYRTVILNIETVWLAFGSAGEFPMMPDNSTGDEMRRALATTEANNTSIWSAGG